MKHVQIESKDVLSKIIDGVTVYCIDVSSERCMACNTMTLEAIKSFVSNPKTIFLAEENDKEDTTKEKKRINGSFLVERGDKEEQINEKKKRINDSFFRKLKDDN